jgi:RHS repeat-associated protein
MLDLTRFHLRPLANVPLSQLRTTLLGLAVLCLSMSLLAVAAVACEGGSGGGSPPTAPPITEQKCTASSPNLQYDCSGKPVNNATGDETEQQTDLSIGGRGPGLRIVRTYDAFNAADATESGVWGYGWAGPYDTSLTFSGEKALVHEEDGSVIEFFKSGSEYTQGGWDQARLVKEGSNYVYTLPEQRKLEFNSAGQLVKETERDGNSNTLTYNGSKELEKVTDGDSRSLTFKYNGEGLVESVTDPLGHEIKYAYSSKQLASVSIEGKERWKFEYETPHLLKKITDGRLNSTTIKYEATTHKAIEEVVGGHTRKWAYKTNETQLTEPNGLETVETFNAAGEPTKVTRKGTGIETTTTEYEYEASTYARTKLIDPNKHETLYGYDSEGNKTSEKDPSGDERKWKYDKTHDIETETTPEGETTTYERNSKGEPTKIERPIGSEKQVTEYKYNASNGDLEEEINPLKNKTKYTYDGAGDKETEVDPEGDERKWKYNKDSQITEETSPRGFVTTTTRNEQGWPTKIEDPLKHTTEYKYDGNGNVESETDGNGHTTKYEYNEENLPIKVEEPNKTVVETGYDSEGKMTSHTDGNKHVWEYVRNKLEQVVEEKNPLSKVWKKTYEKAGNLETVEDPEKHTTTYKYDESNRLKTIKYSTGKPSEVTYTYNKDSKVTKMTDETGTTENTWDKLDRLTEYKNGAGKTVKYEYNLDNQPTKIEYPNKKSITLTYDKAGRLESVTDWNSKVTTFKYNADSQPTSTVFPSGTEDEDTYEYNKADQMTEITMKGPLGATLGKLVYERDNDGQVKKTTTTTLPGPATSESTLDENNRLIEANTHAYKYDKANNPEEIEGITGYTYNTADELEKGGGNTYTYSEDGQRTVTTPSSGEPIHYAYDQAGNLDSVERSSPSIKDTYTYDGTNLRQSQTIGGTKTNLTWNTAEPLPIILSDETNSYIYGPENLPIEQINGSEEPTYLHHDQQGSTRLLTNHEGKNVGAYAYTAYGKTEEHTGTATTPLEYDAQYTTENTGLIYLRARSYDPNTAQFLSIDPALEATGEPYTYTTDNPENAADLTGLCQGEPPSTVGNDAFWQDVFEPWRKYDGYHPWTVYRKIRWFWNGFEWVPLGSPSGQPRLPGVLPPVDWNSGYIGGGYPWNPWDLPPQTPPWYRNWDIWDPDGPDGPGKTRTRLPFGGGIYGPPILLPNPRGNPPPPRDEGN